MWNRWVRVMSRSHEAHADPKQQEPAAELEKRDVEQRDGEYDEHHAQRDGTGRAPEHALHTLRGRQLAASKRDHDGVVSAEQDIDDDDLKDRPPVKRRKEIEHGVEHEGKRGSRMRWPRR